MHAASTECRTELKHNVTNKCIENTAHFKYLETTLTSENTKKLAMLVATRFIIVSSHPIPKSIKTKGYDTKSSARSFICA